MTTVGLCLVAAALWTGAGIAHAGTAPDTGLIVLETAPTQRPGLPLPTFTGTWQWAGAVDLAWGPDEDHGALRQRVDLGLDWEPNQVWRLRLAGRLDEHVAWGRAGRSERARLLASLSEAWLRVRLGPIDLTAGQQDLRWGLTALSQLLDVAGREDLRDGPWPVVSSGRLPRLAVTARAGVGPLHLTAGWLPFAAPPEVTWTDDDWGVARGPFAPIVGPYAPAVEALHGRIRGSDLSGGALVWRVGARRGPVDVAVVGAWRLARVPELSQPRSGVLAVATRRQHELGVGATGVVAPWVFGSAVRVRTSDVHVTAAGRTLTRPTIDATVEAAYRPAPWLDATVALTLHHVEGAADADLLVQPADDAELRARLSTFLSADGRWRLEAGAIVGLRRADVSGRASIDWAVLPSWTLTIGVLFFAAADGGLGWARLYDRGDSLYVRSSLAF